jgi:hypothetical protein
MDRGFRSQKREEEMKNSVTRLLCIVALATIAFAAISSQQGNVSVLLQKVLAQKDDHDAADFIVWQETVGMTANQIVRVSAGNYSSFPISYLVDVSTDEGTMLIRTMAQVVQPGQFNYRDIHYGDLNMTPEPGTGRKHVLLRVIEPRNRQRSSEIVGAVEIINSDGTTSNYQPIDN